MLEKWWVSAPRETPARAWTSAVVVPDHPRSTRQATVAETSAERVDSRRCAWVRRGPRAWSGRAAGPPAAGATAPSGGVDTAGIGEARYRPSGLWRGRPAAEP